jgi:hypothetical protein
VQLSWRLEKPDAISRSCGYWVGSFLTTKQSRTPDGQGPGASQDIARFGELCREIRLLATASDGSKFKAVNNRDKNFTKAKVQRQRAQLEESAALSSERT